MNQILRDEPILISRKYRGFTIEISEDRLITIRNQYGYPVTIFRGDMAKATAIIDRMLDR